MIRYEITEDNGVLLFDTKHNDEVPFQDQPVWPNGDPFTKKQAEAWAKAFVKAVEDPTADEPGDGPDAPTKARVGLPAVPEDTGEEVPDGGAPAAVDVPTE